MNLIRFGRMENRGEKRKRGLARAAHAEGIRLRILEFIRSRPNMEATTSELAAAIPDENYHTVRASAMRLENAGRCRIVESQYRVIFYLGPERPAKSEMGIPISQPVMGNPITDERTPAEKRWAAWKAENITTKQEDE